MSKLTNAIPRDKFVPLFKEVREEVLAEDMPTLQRVRPSDVVGVSLFVWDEMVHRKVAEQPFKIAPIINSGMNGIYEFVEKELGRPPVTDVLATRFFNEVNPEMSFVDVTLVQCFPDDIHISDVEFSDNRRPVGGGKPEKGLRNYHGLHIFDDFIERLKAIARDQAVSRLSLVVGGKGLYEVFARHGFQVSETTMAQIAFKRTGVGFSMYMNVK
ncbi:hypothetical protein BQ8794_570008 [Mesorhizobium prunaredense]|uniref:Uncharacterized protein n=1 Tax=Mesorhizobium prunaredense TaxID=1631249 RepID=A0A1R3VFS9_9HYPH|nr:hypothetical protein [Mesorhizobium prunaredense]SIT58686.1 hypothetical protein BQ8794_570008 [Mesorhizobium prunaredense]